MTPEQREHLKKLAVFDIEPKDETWRSTALELLDEIERLEKERDVARDHHVEIQRHRDAWRGYAYGMEGKPEDFTDGNMSPRPQTEIEMLDAENAKLREQLAALEAELAASQARIARLEETLETMKDSL